MAIGGRASPGPARGFEAPTLTSMSMSMSIEPTGDAYILEGDLTIRVVAEVTVDTRWLTWGRVATAADHPGLTSFGRRGC